jgi:hypothetical protein
MAQRALAVASCRRRLFKRRSCGPRAGKVAAGDDAFEAGSAPKKACFSALARPGAGGQNRADLDLFVLSKRWSHSLYF